MRAYLDHASTSPLRPAALAAMVKWMSAADPGRLYAEGQMARVALEEARAQVGDFLHTKPRQVIFTSGATEAINAAVFGAFAGRSGEHAVMAPVEHSAVREATLRHAGRVTWLGVDAQGRIDPASVLEAIEPSTVLVHCQWANQEVGTIQPVHEVVAACRERGVLVHVDAASAVGHLVVSFDEIGADLLSLSAHKFGGPRGIGALLVRRGLRLPALLVGGSQERARRAGLEDVASAVGFAAATRELGGGGESGGRGDGGGSGGGGAFGGGALGAAGAGASGVGVKLGRGPSDARGSLRKPNGRGT